MCGASVFVRRGLRLRMGRLLVWVDYFGVGHVLRTMTGISQCFAFPHEPRSRIVLGFSRKEAMVRRDAFGLPDVFEEPQTSTKSFPRMG